MGGASCGSQHARAEVKATPGQPAGLDEKGGQKKKKGHETCMNIDTYTVLLSRCSCESAKNITNSNTQHGPLMKDLYKELSYSSTVNFCLSYKYDVI